MKTAITFKTAQPIAQLIEKETDKKGYKNKSDYLTMSVMDSIAGFEAVRHKDTLTDFLDIVKPRLTSLINDKELTVALMNELKILQGAYIKERLLPHMRLQKHLTDQAVLSYLQGDNIVEQTGVEGFIVNNCLVTIYDKLFASGVIDQSEWENHTQHYSMYLEHGEGAKLLKQME